MGMGYFNELQLLEEARGWSSAGDRSACAAHFAQPAIKLLVKGGASLTRCSYCWRRGSRPMAMPVDEILEHIAESVWSEYTNSDTLPRDEGEVLFEVPLCTAEVLMNEGFEADEEVLDDIVGAFGDRMWCRRDWERLRPDLRLISGWSDLKARLSKSRYLFLLDDDPPDAIDLLMDPDAVPPGQLLSELEEGLPGLVADWPTGRPLVRARVHLSAQVVGDAASLGPPPPERATAQRMSPDGVAMFYGAEDAATAIAEVEVHADAQRDMTTVGRFRPQRVLRVVDLTDLAGIPSIFDAEKRHQRPFLRFVSHFAEDIARPAPSSGAPAMYVPTQISRNTFGITSATRTGIGSTAWSTGRLFATDHDASPCSSERMRVGTSKRGTSRDTLHSSCWTGIRCARGHDDGFPATRRKPLASEPHVAAID